MKVLYKKPVLSASPFRPEQATSHFTARRAGRLENSFHTLEIGRKPASLLGLAEKQQAAAQPGDGLQRPTWALAQHARRRRLVGGLVDQDEGARGGGVGIAIDRQ